MNYRKIVGASLRVRLLLGYSNQLSSRQTGTHMSDPSAIVVLVSAQSHEDAARIAEHLVESRLAACVQILPGMESVYRWEGKIEHSSEVLLLAKTTQDKFEELEGVVRSLHSYDTPEILALSVTAGSAPYLAWLTKNVSE